MYHSSTGESFLIVAQNDPVFLSYVNSATGYVNATAIFGDGVKDFQTGILGQVEEFTPKASSDAGVIAGYKAIYATTANTILTSPIGQIELLLATNSAGAIRITAALQHPFSHGQIYINSSNPIDYPVIDPNYLAHPAGQYCCPSRHNERGADVRGQTTPYCARGSSSRASWARRTRSRTA